VLILAEGFVFWAEELRVSGTSTREAAERKLNVFLYETSLTIRERLTGTLEGPVLNVWRSVPFGQAGDVVEFRGTIKPGDDGTVIEGVVAYKLRTKIQFLGCLGFGVVLAVLGAIQTLRAVELGPELSTIGAVITVGTLLWIFASRQMAQAQISFISDKLAEAVNARMETDDAV
jgi:hypothetical protein